MMELQRLHSWLNAPQLSEDQDQNQVYLINQIIKWGFVFISGTLLLWPFFANSPNARQYFYISLSLLLGLFVTKLLLNQGWASAASYLLAAVFWIAFSLAALKNPDGLVSTPLLAAITISPIVAGFAIGTKASVFITLINWGLGGYLTWVDVHNTAQGVTYFEAPLFRFLVLMIMVSVFPLIIYVWQHNLRKALEQVRVTEQARAETAAYRLQNEVLEEAVAARTSALEDSLVREQHMAEKLALALEAETQLGELQSRIITVVSHEFRTPLSVINSSAQLLHQYYDRLPQERRDAVHQRINESIFYLNDLLKDVTLVDKAQRAKIRPSYQTYTFSELCQELANKIKREVNQSQRLVFQFSPTINTPLQTDLLLLEQIVANLASNALKYSDREQLVQIHFWLDGLQLTIEIIDQGIGIPLIEQAKVFELFYRASNVDERRGLGLGLFIVQTISNLLQGSVRLVSKGEGQGTTFVVTVPLIPDLEKVAAEPT